MKKIYTTGEVAKLLGININTVIKWFDDGKIDGFRLPGSRERRITHAALVGFMNTNGIPLDLIEDDGSARERRAKPRFQADIPVQLMMNSKSWEGSISNISEIGALLTLPSQVGNQISLGNFDMDIKFFGETLNGITTQAQIANVRPLNKNIGLGVRFSENPGLREKIRQLYS